MTAALLHFRRLLGRDADSLGASEETAVARLAAAHRRLLIDAGRLNTKSEAGFNACAKFLEELAAAGRALQLDPAARSYRGSFTINYRALFPDETRNYRVDVLEASVEQYAVIWVNGDKFEFSAEAMRRAESLQQAWMGLGALLERYCQANERSRTATRPTRSDMRSALSKLDTAWASFEHRYIVELIAIEEKARRLIVQAIEHERRLVSLEASHAANAQSEVLSKLPEYRHEQQLLVGCIAHLNSVANFRRKGRDDLGVDVLFDAVATLKRCDEAEQGGVGTENLRAARILATDVVESFAAMRGYLREVERCLERVDPHLCNNVGLVQRLVDWEESWEVAARYVQNEALLSAICDFVAEIRAAQRLAPALSSMCEECDVELFLVLPRLIWLRFLAEPSCSRRTELPRMVLPHRFTVPPTSEATHSIAGQPPQAQRWDSELDSFVAKFRRTQRCLIGPQVQQGPTRELLAREKTAWETLVRRVVLGPSSLPAELSVSSQADARTAVEELMHELERWSIELQRHCPEDWNQCSAILVQCLTGGGDRQRVTPGPFHV